MLTVQAEASTTHVVGVLSKRVKAVAAHSEVQASRIADVVSQQLERGLGAVATSIATTSERHSRMAVEEMHKEVQTQL